MLYDFLPDFEYKIYALQDASKLLEEQGQSVEARQAAKVFAALKRLHKELDKCGSLIDELTLAVR